MESSKTNKDLKSLGIIGSLAVFIPAAILIFVQTNFLIPYLSETTGQEIILFWFIVGGLGIFLPLILAGILILKYEGLNITLKTLKERTRFRKITSYDLKWSIGALLLIGVLSGLIMTGLELLIGDFDHSPPFMVFEPLNEGRYWLLIVWLPYWVLNILGEEFLWRGVMMPRQEKVFGKSTWLIQGLGWLLFHITFGWQLLITLIPILFILPYVVQKTKNTWTGVIIHGGLNGPSFIAICFGLI